MPGISCILDKNILSKKEHISKILSEQNYLEGHIDRTLFINENIFIGSNTYSQYPIKVINQENCVVILEGKIYNKSEEIYEKEILSLAKNINSTGIENELSEWLQNSDGDFIIYIYNKSINSIYVINDIFGRLPLYYMEANDNKIIISRYLSFINKLTDTTEIDRISIAEFMLFGFIINNRTMYKNINHLRPASLLKIQNGKIQITNIYNFNFQNRGYTGRDSKEIIKDLSELFSNSCKNRFLNDKHNVVTLSGGLDSRLVASSVYKNRIPFSAVTFRHKYGLVINDEQIASRLTNIFNIDHKVVDIEPPNGKDVFTLLKLKEGMNSLFTSYLIPFYHKVNNLFGHDINFITGDNGDKLIFTLDKPVKKFSDLDELSNFIAVEHGLVSLSSINSLFRVDKDEIINEIKILLTTYPENDLWQKYVHFRVLERPHKFAYQGEDRHRNFFWTLSPFWSFPFYNYFMNCSDSSKKKHRLFAELIKYYSPKAIQLPYSNFKSSITSFKGKIALSALYYLYPQFSKKLKVKFKVGILGWNPQVNKDSIIIQCIKEQLLNSDKILEYINIKDVDTLTNFRKASLFNLLTITSLIEEFYSGKSTIKNYLDKEFI